MSSSNEEYVDQVAKFMLTACRSIIWHDRRATWPKVVRGGSGFVIRFRNRLIGVTAAHVIAAYRTDLAKTPTLVLQLDNIEFDLLNALIDEDQELDIATFAVSPHQLRVEAATIDCSGSWPPPDPQSGSAVSLVGYPELLRSVRRDLSAEFRAYGAFALIEDVTDREIIVVYDPTREQPLAGTIELPPRRFNMSGCSGGPVLVHEFKRGLFRWYPVGMINRGPSDYVAGAIDVDTIRIRRLHFVREDGTIERPNCGWLPTLR